MHGSIEEAQFRKMWERLTPRARSQYAARIGRRVDRRERREAARQAAPATGYCCPKCHTWHPTPVARKACREEHRRQAEAATKAVAA